MKRLIILIILLVIVAIKAKPQEGMGLYGFYDTRIGDLYGFEVETEEAMLEFGYGGIFNATFSNGIYIIDAIATDMKQSRWNLSYFYKPSNIDYVYLGASITRLKYMGKDASEGTGVKVGYKEFSIDPVFGVRYAFMPYLIGDVRIGYGIGLSSKWEGISTYNFLIDEMNDYTDYWEGGAEHFDESSLNELDGFFIGFKVSYFISGE